ncbi:HRDC domain-containing protein [Acinetobacter courvalinii]|jgi:ribonuclease D|uniref:HRDC domain-containing protein n=2 Tax=Acinetobacter TaxID=469 RepID=A0AA42I6I2_9GAMM|nr:MULTISPECIES: HRDC domain-containing protein [Acinetobacter]MBJ8417351.1 HRDC domain-containing protein [Acinetobacter courvalinii]MCU4367060.1 HRDC domain-containing protein [Acinetobacter courvalinii]MCU4389254.1 HRDC domain-containing protein [Acinetobacter courvalinii]MCU4445266.1 HRDC domain-containing protein [Acinetobacter courvalinii]MDH0563042.1 HRDC domain-containing protein [Acinetobacter courvalinii]
MFQFIQQQQDLAVLLSQMEQCSVYALDTEFIKVDTLYPKLGVCQINLNGQILLLDGAALDLTHFWPKIFAAQQNIFHACSEDIDLIYHYADQKPLNNVFDTQVAMAFLGHGLQVSYQNALKTCLNIDIEKDQTRSDWLARPLSQEQMSYAANDVIYLSKLADTLKTDLKAKGLYQYVLEDCQNLTKEIATETPLPELYTDIGNYRHSRRELMQLQQLSIWREQITKALNQPRSFILRNGTMIDLVEKNPRNTFQLAQIKDIRPNVIREHGKTILDLLKFLPPENEWPLRMARPVKSNSKEVAPKIDALIADVVLQTGIPKEVLLRKKWMNAIYEHVVFHRDEQSLPNYLMGWRYDLLTQPLIALLREDIEYLATQMKIAR